MKGAFFDSVEYNNTVFTPDTLTPGDYEDCVFSGCDFTNISLAGFVFSGCRFTGCNLSNVNLSATSFKDTEFTGSKLLGLHFDDCNDVLFSVSFCNCMLNLSSFYRRKMKKTVFKGCSLVDVDFVEADLSGALFENCDFTGAIFQNTKLDGADLRTSSGYSIDPEKNQVRKARFSVSGVAGLLDKYDISIDYSA